MIVRKQISFINRQQTTDPHHPIKNIGGIYEGKLWIISESVALAFMTLAMESYYIMIEGREVNIVFGVYNGRKYLKTAEDDFMPDNLLRLPEIPVTV